MGAGATVPQSRGDTRTVHRGQSGKSIEERVAFALSHRTRVHILMLLNEGVYAAEEIADFIGETKDNVAYHIKELRDAGAIEVARAEPAGNAKKFFYRTIEMPSYSEEELAAMTAEERQVIIGLTIQNMVAEMLSSFWSGKMEAYPKLWLGWRWFNLDSQGRRDLAEEQERWWERVTQIECESTHRRVRSGEEPRSVVVGLMGFPRDRMAVRPPEPPSNFSKR
jgi:DNA-binding transcriptional ArsR family regulator